MSCATAPRQRVALGETAPVRSGRRARSDLDRHRTVRSGERGLRGRRERFAIDVVALSHGRAGLGDPQVGVEQLDLDRLSARERDDRARVHLVAAVGVGRVGDRDRDRVGSAVVVCSHLSSEGRQ